MAQSAPQIFSGISPGQYAKLIEKAKAAGIAIEGNSGTASKFGVEVSWNYAPESQELTFHCLRTPFFVKADEVNARIRKVVNESLA